MEETPSYEGSGQEGGDEVFYIFYEDKKPEASYETPTYQSPPQVTLMIIYFRSKILAI